MVSECFFGSCSEGGGNQPLRVKKENMPMNEYLFLSFPAKLLFLLLIQQDTYKVLYSL